MGVVGGAEAAGRTGGAGAGSARTRGPVGGSDRDMGSGGDADGGGGEAGAGDGFRGAGENTDSNGTTTVGSSGDSGSSGTPTAWPTGALDGGGGLGGEGGGCGRLQAEKGGSGLDIGGNSDSGGPDDAVPNGAVPDGDISRPSAGAAEERSASCPRGAKGRRAETRNPHASQNWPTTADPQRGQLSLPLATNRPGA